MSENSIDPAINVDVLTRRWLKDFVIKHNLCPFARQVLLNDAIRIKISESQNENQLVDDFIAETEYLTIHSEIETTLLVLPFILDDFTRFNQFLDITDELIAQLDLSGILQIATFHPQYQFSNTDFDDVENFTNRSPFPILQLLREASLELAISSFGDTSRIPEKNISIMKKMGKSEIQTSMKSFMPDFNPSTSKDIN